MKTISRPVLQYCAKFASVCLFVIGTIACQKEEEFMPNTPLDESTVLINEIRTWFEGTDKDSIAATPRWQDSWVKITKEDAGIVKVPLENGQFADSIYWDVLIRKESKAFKAQLIQVSVDPAYLSMKINERGVRNLPIRDYIENEDFTGEIYRYSLDGKFEMGRRYKAGTIIRALHPLESFKDLLALGKDPVALYRFKEYVPNGGGAIDGGTLPGVIVTPPAEDDWYQGHDWLNPPADDDDYPSDPGAGIPIGGGGGSSSTTISATFDEGELSEFELIIDPGDAIENIEDYIECFNDGKPGIYKLAIYVDQPVPGKNDQYNIIPGDIALTPQLEGTIVKTSMGKFEVGHTFVSFEKLNTDGTYVRQSFGFYPRSGGPGPVEGAIFDDSGSPYDVGYISTVNKEAFFTALKQVQADIDNKVDYILTNGKDREYNCSDAALKWLEAGGIKIDDASRGIFKNTPGDLGQALRKIPNAVTQSGKAGPGTGPCN